VTVAAFATLAMLAGFATVVSGAFLISNIRVTKGGGSGAYGKLD
jgi:hypothetical protein